MTTKNAKTASFEEALAEMERTIEHMERENLTLHEALTDFERGVALMRICDDYLKKAEGTLKELTKGENGEFIEKILGSAPDSFSGEDQSDA